MSPQPTSDTILESLYTQARAAWPEVDLPREAFDRYLLARSEASGAGGAGLDQLHATDLFLACACSAGDPAAVARFDRDFLGQVPLFLSRSVGGPAVADEVKQVLRERLLMPRGDRPGAIEDYAGRGPLGGWVRIAALRAAANLQRDGEASDARGRPDSALAQVEPELALIKARYRPVFERALADAVGVLSPRDRSVMRLHFLDGLNIEKVGTMFQVHRATVARWLVDARVQLLAEVRARVKLELRLSDAELDSLMGEVRSQLDVSLHSLLRFDAQP